MVFRPSGASPTSGSPSVYWRLSRSLRWFGPLLQLGARFQNSIMKHPGNETLTMYCSYQPGARCAWYLGISFAHTSLSGMLNMQPPNLQQPPSWKRRFTDLIVDELMKMFGVHSIMIHLWGSWDRSSREWSLFGCDKKRLLFLITKAWIRLPFRFCNCQSAIHSFHQRWMTQRRRRGRHSCATQKFRERFMSAPPTQTRRTQPTRRIVNHLLPSGQPRLRGFQLSPVVEPSYHSPGVFWELCILLSWGGIERKGIKREILLRPWFLDLFICPAIASPAVCLNRSRVIHGKFWDELGWKNITNGGVR